MNVIEMFELTKSYGKQVAVDQLNLTVPSGAVFGLIGPGGSGKTTLLRMLATLATPTGGDATVAGMSITASPSRVRRVIGYMPDSFGVYPQMSVNEYLRFFANCYGVPESDQISLVSDLLQLVDLAHKRNDQLDQLTHGMRQRLSLARTLAHDPQVLLLDEPITGADPRAHVEMRELIKELRNMGKSVVITAPVIADVEELCTHIAILDRGKTALSGTYSSVQDRARRQRTIVIKFFGNADLATSIVVRTPGIVDVQHLSSGEVQSTGDLPGADITSGTPPAVITILKQLRVRFNGSYNDASEMLRMLMRSGVQVVSFSEQADSAEDLLMDANDRLDLPL
jgi:ABC-2 type transport system ATP-binding protein